MTDPVVLLHGFLGCAEDFAEIAQALAPQHCIALVLPGHGVDPLPPRATDFAAAVEEVREQIVRAGIRRGHLVGYSMGGRIALAMAASHPDLVLSATAIGASAGIESAAERSARRARDLATAERLESGDLANFLSSWYSQDLFASLRQHERFPAVLARRARGDARALAQALRAFGPGTQEPLAPRLAQTNTPILLIAGALDAKYVSANARLAAAVPHAACRTVPGAGHSVHLENPQELVRVLLDFLAQHRSHPVD